MLLSSRFPAAILTVATLFTAVWFVLAGYLTAWSDEISHMSAAKGLLLTGKPFTVVFDLCARLQATQYHRGLEISWMTALSYEIFGESLRAARLVPFLFTIATWLLYIGYTRWQGSSSSQGLLVATVLFFWQSMVLEKALYVRVYAPLLFFLLLSLIAIWEAVKCWRARRLPLAMVWLGVAALSIGVTAGWHLLQFAILVLAIVFLWMMIRQRPVGDLLQRIWKQLLPLPARWKYPGLTFLLLAAILTMVTAPRIINILGVKLFGLQPVHVTPWDNLFGLLRFLLVTNVLLLLWWRRGSPSDSERDFNSWILDAGVISGFLVALLVHHNWVFWSRFFYLSVALVALGASGRAARLVSKYHVAAVLGAYVLVNALVSSANFSLDRSNIKEAINWLRYNSIEQDIVLAFNAELYLHGGEDLCGRTTSILNVQFVDTASKEGRGLAYLRRSGNYPYITGDNLMAILSSGTSGNVYFLYTDHHEFRDNLYRWTTGRRRSVRNDLFGLLKDGHVGEEVISGLRGSGLTKIDRGKLLTALEIRAFP